MATYKGNRNIEKCIKEEVKHGNVQRKQEYRAMYKGRGKAWQRTKEIGIQGNV